MISLHDWLDIKIMDAREQLAEAQRTGGQNCYGSGYAQGHLDLLRDLKKTISLSDLDNVLVEQ